MSFNSINIHYELPIINGFVQPADGQKTLSNRVTPAEAMTAIAGSVVFDYRYNREYTTVAQVDFDFCFCHDKLVLRLPPIKAGQSYGDNEDHHETLRALGLM